MRVLPFRLERLLKVQHLSKKRLDAELATTYSQLEQLELAKVQLLTLKREARESSGMRVLLDGYLRSIERDELALEQSEELLCRQAAAILSKLDDARGRHRATERLKERHEILVRRQRFENEEAHLEDAYR